MSGVVLGTVSETLLPPQAVRARAQSRAAQAIVERRSRIAGAQPVPAGGPMRLPQVGQSPLICVTRGLRLPGSRPKR